MVEIIEATTKKEQKRFLDFPLKMYKDCPYFAPPLYSDEKKIFNKDYVYYDTCKAVYYNAYRDGVMVGRISGILQSVANEKNNRKQIRFTRFDSIDDEEVAKALFDAVENWGRSLGMEECIGPMGFSDLEREGLLIDGFDKMATFEEQYNFPYYQKLIEAQGYTKDVDWFESEIRHSAKNQEKLDQIAKSVMERYHLKWSNAKNTNDFVKKYANGFFDVLDKSYNHIYGTVPFTDGMKEMMLENFKLIINLKYVDVLLDENDNVVCMGLCFPAIGEALQKSGGHLTPLGLIRTLHAINHPKVIDFALIGVDPDWANRGVSAAMIARVNRMLADPSIDHAETNLNLEDNLNIRNLWKRFESVEHKKRRSFIKKI